MFGVLDPVPRRTARNLLRVDQPSCDLDVEEQGTRFLMDGYVCTGCRLKIAKGAGPDFGVSLTSP